MKIYIDSILHDRRRDKEYLCTVLSYKTPQNVIATRSLIFKRGHLDCIIYRPNQPRKVFSRKADLFNLNKYLEYFIDDNE